MFFNRKKKLIKKLILLAQDFGARPEDVSNSLELIKHKEYRLSFETIVTQIYEHEIEVNKTFYSLVQEISKTLDLNLNDYSFVKELVKEENKISELAKKKIRVLMSQLMNQ